jgi:dTDP-glucose 4,6-dehydratase
VIHAATPTHSPLYQEAPETILEVIVQGMRRVLDFAWQAGARRFLFTRSGAVFGRQPAQLDRTLGWHLSRCQEMGI